jgi:hypothetical protein
LLLVSAQYKRDDAVAAIRRWYLEHGRLPAWADWDRTGPGRPTAKTVSRRWGWEQLRREAVKGLVDDAPGPSGRRWTHDTVVAAIRRWTDANGRPPNTRDWDKTVPGYPNQRTVVRLFGSWRGAVAAAHPSDRGQV